MSKFCAYQERSQFEVERKMRLLKIPGHLHEAVVSKLMEEDFLNEYRFTEAYIRGKLSMKHWAPKRIALGLREHRVPAPMISTGLASIPKEKVLENGRYLALRWFGSKSKAQFTGAMQRRGYSFDVINESWEYAEAQEA